MGLISIEIGDVNGLQLQCCVILRLIPVHVPSQSQSPWHYEHISLQSRLMRYSSITVQQGGYSLGSAVMPLHLYGLASCFQQLQATPTTVSLPIMKSAEMLRIGW